MAKGQFEKIFDMVMSGVAAVTGDPSQAVFPYAAYGRKDFEASDGVPPRVFCKKVDWRMGATMDTGGFGVTGSLVTWNQGLLWRVWGSDEDETERHTSNILRVMGTAAFANIFNIVETEGTWYPQDSDHDWEGEMTEFTTYVPYDVSNIFADTALIVTASAEISSSFTGSFTTAGVPSGSWSFWKDVLTTSSL